MVRDTVDGETPEAGPDGKVAVYEGADGEARADCKGEPHERKL